jgi:hypothetical protein
MDSGTIFVLVMAIGFFLLIAYLAFYSRRSHDSLRNPNQQRQSDREKPDSQRRDAA